MDKNVYIIFQKNITDLETFTTSNSGNINILSWNKMANINWSANWKKCIFRYWKFVQFSLKWNSLGTKMPQLRLCQLLRLLLPCSNLNLDI